MNAPASCAPQYGSTLRPREAAPHRERQRHGRIQVRAGHAAGDVHAHDDRQAPAEIDREIRSVRLTRQHHLRDDGRAEHDEHECAEKLG